MKFSPSLILLLLMSLRAQGAIEVGGPLKGEMYGEELYLFEDEENKITINDIIDKSLDKEFTKSDSNVPNFGFKHSAFWAKIPLVNHGAVKKTVLIEYRYANADFVTLYSIEGDQVTTQASGDKIPYNNRSVKNRYPVFKIEVPPGSHDYYMKIETLGTNIFPLLFWSEKSFHEHATEDSHLLGLLFGITIAMGLYNIFLFASLKARVYLYYVFHLTFFLLHNWAAQGSGQVYFFHDSHNHWISNQGFLIFSELSIIFAVLFSIDFLNVKERFPVLHKFLIGVRIVGIINILNVEFFSYEIGAKIANLDILLSCLTMLFMGVRSFRAGYRPAYFYTIAWALAIFSSIFLVLKYQGYLPLNWWTSWAHLFGVPTGAILMSLALGDRFNYYREKKEQEVRSLSDQLAKSLSNVEEQVKEKTREIRSIMTHIQQGVFMIGQDGAILPDFSNHLHVIFGAKDLASTKGIDLLLNESNLSSDAKDLVEVSVNTCLGEDILNFDSNRHNLMNSIVRQSGEQGKNQHLEIDWAAIENEDSQVVENILVTVRDVTNLKDLESQADKQSRQLKAIGILLSIKEENFNVFCKNFLELEEQSKALTRETNPSSDQIKVLFRNLHTIKGSARVLGLTSLSDLAHDLESFLDSVRREEEVFDRELFNSSFSNIKHEFEYYQEINFNILGRQYSKIASRDVIDEVLNLVNDIDVNKSSSSIEGSIKKIKSILENSTATSFTEALNDILASMEGLAAKLGKENPDIIIDDDNFVVSDQGLSVLRGVFLHLFRNSIDHGIENVSQRVANGKEKQGRIFIKLNEESDTHCRITYYDDGAGINLSQLRKKLIAENIMSREENWPLEKLIESIFHPGITTAPKITDVSGRGVGMDAVKGSLINIGGAISMEYNQKDIYTLNGDEMITFKVILDLPIGFIFTRISQDANIPA